MTRPDQEAIDTFISITGVSKEVAVRKLQEHGGDLNEAVNAHFNEGDRNIIHQTSAAPENDVIDIDEPTQVGSLGLPFSLMSSARNLNPFSLLDSNFTRSLFNSGPDCTTHAPFVSHPREVREIPIEVKDGSGQSGPSVHAPTIEDVTGTAEAHGPETHGTVIIDDDDEEDNTTAPFEHIFVPNEPKEEGLGPRPSAPGVDYLPDYSNEIEEEMIRAAIEASKREVEKVDVEQQFGAQNVFGTTAAHQSQSHLEDAELANAVSLSLKEIETQLAAKEASLPHEPTSDVEDAVTLLVRMPDGSRRGRRFLKSDKLRSLFDFIDVGRGVKPGTYKLVRPFPRRAFSDKESDLSLNELGLTSKQEALFLELI